MLYSRTTMSKFTGPASILMARPTQTRYVPSALLLPNSSIMSHQPINLYPTSLKKPTHSIIYPSLTLSPLSSLVTTEKLTTTAAHDILAAQRLNRPVSPHLSIYRPQVTWYASALNRITGAVLSGGLYVFAAAYLVSPLLGW